GRLIGRDREEVSCTELDASGADAAPYATGERGRKVGARGDLAELEIAHVLEIRPARLCKRRLPLGAGEIARMSRGDVVGAVLGRIVFVLRDVGSDAALLSVDQRREVKASEVERILPRGVEL